MGGYARPVLAELTVPGGQVLVSHLPCRIKHKDGGVGLVVVGHVHCIEPLLPRSVPKVYDDVPKPNFGPVAVQGQGVGG